MEPLQQREFGFHFSHDFQQQQEEMMDMGFVQMQEEKERLPQWTQLETRELLRIRGELDKSFMETKRNKSLWEFVSTTMREKGFSRTPDQCKCKWKNLVTRYKGMESVETPGEMSSSTRQFQFQEEIKEIFTSRMERLLSFEEGKKESPGVQIWSEDDEEEEDQHEVEVKNKRRRTTTTTKKKKKNVVRVGSRREGGVDADKVKRAIKDFMEWQMKMEVEWEETAKAREVERRSAEQEWRRVMMMLAERRVEMDRRWREKEEERKMREEERAERRHHLMVAILTRLSNRGM